MSNFGKAFTILDANGKPIGRAIPRKEAHKGFATTFVVNGQLSVRLYGNEEMALKETVNGWTRQPSFLTVTRVAKNTDNTVSVTLMHNLFSGWNQLLTVPFVDGWQKSITAQLIELNRTSGCETHISNYGDLIV